MFKVIRKKKLNELENRISSSLDIIRCRIDVSKDIVDDYLNIKSTKLYCNVYEKENPLVSVCIATYNRADILTKRTLPSILNQTYKNIEVIVVGDCCSDDTQQKIEALNDERIRFINLERRGEYPTEPHFRWMVAGTKPMNHALENANGDFITHLDDDDRYPLDRIEKLVQFAQKKKADFVWHPFHRENENGKWKLVAAKDFCIGNVTTSSVFYHSWLKCIEWDLDAWRFYEPGDWNRFRKFKYIGVNAHYFPESMLFHYKEKNQ